MNRILVAEDEERISQLIERRLRAEGFAVHTVADGNAALAEAISGDYDLLILDLGLPKRDGMVVLSELRRIGVNLPVIILSARDSVADTVAGLKGGADDYLRKPFAFDELLARIWLRLRQDPASD